MKGYLTHIVVALAIVQLSHHISSCTAHEASPGLETIDYIKTSCNVTTYPRLCCNVLKIHAGKIETSSKVLAQTALDEALEFTKQTHIAVKSYSEIKALNPVVIAATRDCVDELNVAVEMLQKSKFELGIVIEGSAFKLHVSNVQTWVSAALSNLNTCKDGFVNLNLNGEVQKITAKKIVKATHLTSNALALINLCVSTKVALP